VSNNGERNRLRARFLEDHIAVLEKALKEGKIDVRGFKMKFGLFAVDLQTKKRIMRKSAETYKKIIEAL